MTLCNTIFVFAIVCPICLVCIIANVIWQSERAKQLSHDITDEAGA